MLVVGVGSRLLCIGDSNPRRLNLQSDIAIELPALLHFLYFYGVCYRYFSQAYTYMPLHLHMLHNIDTKYITTTIIYNIININWCPEQLVNSICSTAVVPLALRNGSIRSTGTLLATNAFPIILDIHHVVWHSLVLRFAIPSLRCCNRRLCCEFWAFCCVCVILNMLCFCLWEHLLSKERISRCERKYLLGYI